MSSDLTDNPDATKDLYHTDQDALDPDPFITELNAELAACDDATSTTLGDRERQYVDTFSQAKQYADTLCSDSYSLAWVRSRITC